MFESGKGQNIGTEKQGEKMQMFFIFPVLIFLPISSFLCCFLQLHTPFSLKYFCSDFFQNPFILLFDNLKVTDSIPFAILEATLSINYRAGVLLLIMVLVQ